MLAQSGRHIAFWIMLNVLSPCFAKITRLIIIQIIQSGQYTSEQEAFPFPFSVAGDGGLNSPYWDNVSKGK